MKKGHFTPYTYMPVDIKEFNKMLAYCKSNKYLIIGKPAYNERIGFKAYLNDSEVEVQLTVKIGSRVRTYVTRKDEQPVIKANGMKAWTELNKFYKVPHAKFPSKKQFSASAILGNNPKYNGQRFENCYGYDINSSYTYAMTQDLPDTSVQPKIGAVVKKDEIGFDADYNLVFTGHFAMLVYPKMESPFKKFASVWYSKKKNAKTKQEKGEAKMVLNAAVGYLQRVNPVLRAAIIWYANDRVKKLIDEDTLYWNTDSIISKRRRLDIEKDLGLELGQWKIEHQGTFAYKNFNYQWNNDIPSYRGISKAWFKEGFDILKDEIPTKGNKYRYDSTKNKLVEV